MGEQSKTQWPFPAPNGFVWHQPEAPYLAHESARIEAGARIKAGARIEAGAQIEAGARIGPNAVIGSNAVIGPNAVIGAHGAGYAHVMVGSYEADIYRDADGVVWLRYGRVTYTMSAWTQERIIEVCHNHEPERADYYIRRLTALVQAAPMLLAEEADDE